MIRRPRYPLALRLAWLESEVGSAAKLAHLIVGDMRSLRDQSGGAEARALLAASLAAAALLLLGAEPRLLHDFIEAMSPGGDLEEAEAIAADILGQALLHGAAGEGGTH